MRPSATTLARGSPRSVRWLVPATDSAKLPGMTAATLLLAATLARAPTGWMAPAPQRPAPPVRPGSFEVLLSGATPLPGATRCTGDMCEGGGVPASGAIGLRLGLTDALDVGLGAGAPGVEANASLRLLHLPLLTLSLAPSLGVASTDQHESLTVLPYGSLSALGALHLHEALSIDAMLGAQGGLVERGGPVGSPQLGVGLTLFPEGPVRVSPWLFATVLGTPTTQVWPQGDELAFGLTVGVLGRRAPPPPPPPSTAPEPFPD